MNVYNGSTCNNSIMRCWTTWLNSITTGIFLLLLMPWPGESEKSAIPKFLPRPSKVTTAKGEMAILLCAIENLGTKTVIWRKQPYKVPILIGNTQFLELDRYQLHREPRLDEWNLLIKNAQPFDSGTYECQVSSKGNYIRKNITLTVLDALRSPSKPEIRVTGTQFVEKGDSVHLVCNVSGTVDPPQSIDWFKNGNRLESRYHRDLYIQEKVSLSSKTIVSALDIHKASMSDTGEYICRAADDLAARIKVDVLNAETYNEKRDTESDISANPNAIGTMNRCSDTKGSYTVVAMTLIVSIVFTFRDTAKSSNHWRSFNSDQW